MLTSWSSDLSGSPETSSQILSQFLWFKKYIKIEGTAIHFPKSFNKGINFILQLFQNGRIISWVSMGHIDMSCASGMFFQWAQSKHAILAR